MTNPTTEPVAGSTCTDFLAACAAAAAGASVTFMPGREGIAADYDEAPNPDCRSILDGHAPGLHVLDALHLRARCEFRLPVERLPRGVRIVQDGADMEVLARGRPSGEGEPIAAGLLDDEVLIASLLLPDGLDAFADEHLEVTRGLSDLRPRFGVSDVEFHIRRAGRTIAIHCRFTAEMDACAGRAAFEDRGSKR